MTNIQQFKRAHMVLAALIAVQAASGQVWSGQFSLGANKNELLKLENGSFYLSSAPTDQPPDWSFAGSPSAYTIGAGGVYVADLEGYGKRKTVAFFDPLRQTWLWGALDEQRSLRWTEVGENTSGRTMFHVGDGPFLAPVDQIEITSEDRRASAHAAVTSQPLVSPLVFPAVGTQATNLARSQHMQTTVIIDRSGETFATTHVWEDTALAGFHGAAIISFLAEDGKTQLWTLKQGPIGVTGVWFGHSNVTVSEDLGQVPANVLPFVRKYAIIHMWEPQWLTALQNIKQFLDLLLGITTDAAGIVKTFATIGK